MKILVLGHRGVIGSAVAATVAVMGHELLTTSLRLPSPYFGAVMRGLMPDGIINCISVPLHASAEEMQFAYQRLPALLDTFGCPAVQPFAVDDAVEVSGNAHVVTAHGEHAAARASCINHVLDGTLRRTRVLAAQLIGLSLRSRVVTPLDYFLSLSHGACYETCSNRIISPITTTEWARHAVAALKMSGTQASVVACGGQHLSEAGVWAACARAFGRKDLVQEVILHDRGMHHVLMPNNFVQPLSLYAQMRAHRAIVAGGKPVYRNEKKDTAAVAA